MVNAKEEYKKWWPQANDDKSGLPVFTILLHHICHNDHDRFLEAESMLERAFVAGFKSVDKK